MGNQGSLVANQYAIDLAENEKQARFSTKVTKPTTYNRLRKFKMHTKSATR